MYWRTILPSSVGKLARRTDDAENGYVDCNRSDSLSNFINLTEKFSQKCVKDFTKFYLLSIVFSAACFAYFSIISIALSTMCCFGVSANSFVPA